MLGHFQRVFLKLKIVGGYRVTRHWVLVKYIACTYIRNIFIFYFLITLINIYYFILEFLVSCVYIYLLVNINFSIRNLLLYL